MTTMMVECNHAQSTDPRYESTCRKCGRDMAVLGLLRDVDRERALVRRCAKRPEIADALFDYAARRADEGPWRDCAVRDWRREALEEIADGVNYLAGGLAQQRRLLGYEDELSCGQLQALSYLIRAYECLVRGDFDE